MNRLLILSVAYLCCARVESGLFNPLKLKAIPRLNEEVLEFPRYNILQLMQALDADPDSPMKYMDNSKIPVYQRHKVMFAEHCGDDNLDWKEERKLRPKQYLGIVEDTSGLVRWRVRRRPKFYISHNKRPFVWRIVMPDFHAIAREGLMDGSVVVLEKKGKDGERSYRLAARRQWNLRKNIHEKFARNPLYNWVITNTRDRDIHLEDGDIVRAPWDLAKHPMWRHPEMQHQDPNSYIHMEPERQEKADKLSMMQLHRAYEKSQYDWTPETEREKHWFYIPDDRVRPGKK
uniref:Uncharacterized protein n=1 Tax=Fibrocapsa japonica TaxID=94617 RepID=A0A7S2UYX0_9STRA|mmetsp:Transcript_17648/g.25776  ORF Transcript_17648/g.25776 Transcript_17648/m.25776 type:complete len:289 (+) Transcript_17648:56-922(+)|eukprot:CAMPEP_0113938914 /NCGR_PEP_ID=MMETSP1339-20121228/5325_1 /TAXON_ID=94617 /ORGANISM="Fibrocapsa japonica" /LENGTH=288 /DNA_ID=CAMNT_0000942247 /DNA_START=53 /DNA_END=919 /DNA_ORIENTATION=- /assembly_acc=CAM_ASM_000762